MNTNSSSDLSGKKVILALFGIPVLVGAWWAFRPEKLFINQKVNEAVPASLSSEPEALYTGKLEGKAHQTSGRATIYKSPDGMQYLRLTDFTTSNGPDVHVILVTTKDAMDDANFLKNNTDKVELGKLKGNEGDQNYEIPAGTDLTKFRTVSVYCERFHAIFGVARLEKF